MSPKESNRLVDFSEASQKPESINNNAETETSEINPDDYLPKNQEDETEPNKPTNVVDHQIITANLSGG